MSPFLVALEAALIDLLCPTLPIESYTRDEAKPRDHGLDQDRRWQKTDGAIVAFGGYLSWYKLSSGHVVPDLARRELDLLPRQTNCANSAIAEIRREAMEKRGKSCKNAEAASDLGTEYKPLLCIVLRLRLTLRSQC